MDVSEGGEGGKEWRPPQKRTAINIGAPSDENNREDKVLLIQRDHEGSITFVVPSKKKKRKEKKRKGGGGEGRRKWWKWWRWSQEESGGGGGGG